MTHNTLSVLRRADHFAPGYPLSLHRVRSHAQCRLHAHEFSELVIVLRGRGRHVTPSSSWPIGAGDAFILHGGEAHGYEDTAGLDLVNIMFVPDELDLADADLGHLPGYHALFTLEPRVRSRDQFASRLRLSADQLRSVSVLVDRLEHELTRRPAGWQFSARACFMLIVTDLSRYYERVEAPEALTVRRLGQALSYIERHLADAPRLADIAAASSMSRRSLSRAFRDAMGCTPVQYMVRLRIDRALELLRNSDESISEIAYALGYADSAYFSKQFHQQTGLTPRQARRMALMHVADAAASDVATPHPPSGFAAGS